MTAIQTKQIQLNVGHFSLQDITLQIPEGKITAIVGPNGSGKSTLLKVITRLIHADQGEVFILEKLVNSYKTKELARTISMLPQSKGMLPDLTVKEIVSYGRSPYKRLLEHRMTVDDNHMIEWALNVTGTKKHEERLFHTLSGGEQQKVRIAMALAQKTDILLLDEPTTFLDIAHQLDVMEMLQKLNREYQMTIVMVLHDLQQAAAYCHHLIAMKRGNIATTGNPQTVVNSEFLRSVYEIEAKVKFDDGYPLIIPIKQNYRRNENMVIVTNTSQIKKGFAHKLIERFDRVGKVEFMEGFLGLEVLLTENTPEYEEVSVVTRWSEKENFQAWTKSEAFRESHTHRQIPDYIISNKISFYEVKITRQPLTTVE